MNSPDLVQESYLKMPRPSVSTQTRVLLIQAVRTIFKGSDVFDAPDDRVTAAAALADLTLSVA